MKPLFTCLLALAAATLIGACDSHPWSETKALHEKYQEHGAGHGEEHHAEAAGEHAATGGHNEAAAAPAR